MTRNGHFVALLGTAMLVGSGLCGCENNHEKWVREGDRRWLDMRSAALLDKAEREFETGDLDLAEQTVGEVLSFDRDNARFYILAGRIALERGRLERGYHLFDTAIKFAEDIPEAYYYQGIVLQRWQQFDRAKDRYSKAYEIEPDNVSYLLAMGEMFVALGRMDEAIDLFEEKLTYFDQNAALRTAIGHLYSMKDQPGFAADYFGKAALLSPDDSRILEELSLVHLEAKQYGKAIQILTQLIKEPDLKDRDDLKRALAGAYAKVNQVNEASDLYVDLARSRNGQASDWIKVGELALKRGDLFAAARAAKQAIQADPQAHEGYLLAGLIQQKRGRLEEALRMFDRAADRNSKVVEPFLLRGIALHKDGHPAAAAQAFSEAIQRRPDDLRAKRLLECVNRPIE